MTSLLSLWTFFTVFQHFTVQTIEIIISRLIGNEINSCSAKNSLCWKQDALKSRCWERKKERKKARKEGRKEGGREGGRKGGSAKQAKFSYRSVMTEQRGSQSSVVEQIRTFWLLTVNIDRSLNSAPAAKP